MNEQYKWNYDIKIKTKEGTFEYEDKLENIDSILEKHPNYEQVEAKQKVLKKGVNNGRKITKNN